MRISVIIPTFNRAHVLSKTLRGYSEQVGEHQICEILVVDDGSEDDTSSVVQEWSNNKIAHVRYLRQENRGPAAARNHAIREARGDLLLFGDDDIIPSSKLVAEHVAWHREHPEPNFGVLGLVNWAAEMNPTPFMEWSGLYGPQFNFGYFKAGMELGFQHAYGCNLSLKASFLARHGVFNESIRSAGWEDLELCYRLNSQGFRLFYSAEAVGYHHKFESFDDARQRIEKLYSAWPAFGRTEAGRQFLKRQCGNGSVPARWKQSTLRRTLKPLKSTVIPLIRPLMDTRIPLPHWLYNQVFYYYTTPFSRYVDCPEEAPGSLMSL